MPAEYFDRLPYDKIEQLREVIGTGEMGWKSAFPELPENKKLIVGEVVFGKDVKIKKVWMEFERNASTGYNIPVICAEFEKQ